MKEQENYLRHVLLVIAAGFMLVLALTGCAQAIFTKEPVEPCGTETEYAYTLKLNWFLIGMDVDKVQYRNIFGMEMSSIQPPNVTAITPGAVVTTEKGD